MPQSGLADVVTWIAHHHPEIDFKSPPVRPPPLAESIAAFRAAHGG
jgi:hypothetical protein